MPLYQCSRCLRHYRTAKHSELYGCRFCHVRLLLVSDRDEVIGNRQPVQLVPLSRVRVDLAQVPNPTVSALRLASLSFQEVETRWSLLQMLLRQWFASVKRFEQTDTFAKAYHEGRLAIRWCNNGFEFSYPNMQAKKKPEDLNDHTFVGFPSNVGLTGIKLRLDPTKVTRAKRLQHGLHALSGTLLDKRFEIDFRQIHTKTPTGEWFVFTALLPNADQSLIIRLIEILEQTRHSGMRRFIEYIFERLTHTKYAYSQDMGTGFLAHLDSKDNPVDFEYIPKACKGNDEKSLGSVTFQMATCRKFAATYQDILNSGKKNELTLEFRQHAGPFPVFTKYEDDCFVQYDVSGPNPVRGVELLRGKAPVEPPKVIDFSLGPPPPPSPKGAVGELPEGVCLLIGCKEH